MKTCIFKRLFNDCRCQQPAVSVQAVDAQQPPFMVQLRAVVGQGRAEVGFHVHDAGFGQAGQHAVRRGHEFHRAAQAHGRTVFAFDLAGTHYEQVARARHDVDAVARVQQAHRALQPHARCV